MVHNKYLIWRSGSSIFGYLQYVLPSRKRKTTELNWMRIIQFHFVSTVSTSITNIRYLCMYVSILCNYPQFYVKYKYLYVQYCCIKICWKLRRYLVKCCHEFLVDEFVYSTVIYWYREYLATVMVSYIYYCLCDMQITHNIWSSSKLFIR